MEISYLMVVVCAVLSMIVGSVWYGPLFGKKWMEICGVDPTNLDAIKQMQKEAMPLYGIQFVLSLLQLYILAHFVQGWSEASGIESAVWMWLGFVMPTVAGSAMWNNSPNRLKWASFLIQAGYQLVMFVIYGYILGMWG
jgi:Protein of unknown function (DUF1761)